MIHLLQLSEVGCLSSELKSGTINYRPVFILKNCNYVCFVAEK